MRLEFNALELKLKNPDMMSHTSKPWGNGDQQIPRANWESQPSPWVGTRPMRDLLSKRKKK